MAVELYNLIKQVNTMDITLAAGEKGIHNIATWVHMVETIEAADFLEGGEVAFTTGFGLNNRQSLLELTKSIYNHNAAGIVLNTGPFLEKVSDDVIAFANEHDFPIFIVPWKVHLAEIMRIFSLTLIKADQKNLETAAAFKNAIFFPKQEELYVVQLSQRGFRVNWNYAVCAINITDTQYSAPQKLNSIIVSLENHMQHSYENFAIFIHDSEVIVILADYTNEALNNFIYDLKEHLKILLSGK